MFKKNKKKNLAILIASIMCMSAFGFSSVSAMQNNVAIVNQMKEDIRKDLIYVENAQPKTNEEYKEFFEKMSTVMEKYADILEKNISNQRSQNDNNNNQEKKYNLQPDLIQCIKLINKFFRMKLRYMMDHEIFRKKMEKYGANSLNPIERSYIIDTEKVGDKLYEDFHASFSMLLSKISEYIKLIYDYENVQIDNQQTDNMIKEFDNSIKDLQKNIEAIETKYPETSKKEKFSSINILLNKYINNSRIEKINIAELYKTISKKLMRILEL